MSRFREPTLVTDDQTGCMHAASQGGTVPEFHEDDTNLLSSVPVLRQRIPRQLLREQSIDVMYVRVYTDIIGKAVAAFWWPE